VFEISEAVTRKRASAHAELDQFNLEAGDDLTPKALGVQPGSVLVMVRNYNTLYSLASTLDRVDAHKQDVVALHLRFLARGSGGEYELAPEQLFSTEEQILFTRALGLAEKKGKTIHLAVAGATDKWEAVLKAAQSLESSVVVLGASPNRPPCMGAPPRSQAATDSHRLLPGWTGARVLSWPTCSAPHAKRNRPSPNDLARTQQRVSIFREHSAPHRSQ
jgi:hypothetical protein